MPDDSSLSSGFIDADAEVKSVSSSDDLKELYASPSGFNHIFICRRYNKLHVIKALQSKYCGNPFYEQALQKEFNIGYQLDHSNICHTLGWEDVPTLGHCILMEYVDGVTLKSFMEEGKLTTELAYKLIRQLCEALSYMHNKQIVHRDLKPSNILITYNGNNVKLIDFGLSDCDDYDVLKLPAGTRCYMAPEALKQNGTLDLRADIYSLGIIIGEMAAILKDKSLAIVSRKCTRQKPDDRYATAQEVADAAVPSRSIKRYLAVGTIVVVLMLFAVFGFVILYDNASSDNVANVSPAISTYGNVSVDESCRHILSECRVSLSHRIVTSEEQIAQDSILLVKQLKDALDKNYPLPEQQASVTYQKQWAWLLSEVSRMMSDWRRLSR